MPKRRIDNYQHLGKQRANNPPVGLVTDKTDSDSGAKTKKYKHDPHLDPQLQWAGKAEGAHFGVNTVSLHVHERIDPCAIMDAVRKHNGAGAPQGALFAKERRIPLRQAIEFYRHSHNWSNRLIAGDSLLVMNSLLQKESMAGKVQCVYMDPPYGVKYGSNFQPFVGGREVKDGKAEHLTAEPEMIKAFRDTWEMGVHSYLSYLRDRLLLARKLLNNRGSVFVQIGDENVHRVGGVMDDIFGAENRVATITFATTSGSSTAHLPQVADYILWYAKDKKRFKYRQLFESLTRAEVIDYFSSYAMVELADGACRKLKDEERFDPDKHIPEGARIYRRTGLDSQGVSTTGRSKPYKWNGKTFRCSPKRQWSVSSEDMDRLAELNRLDATEGKNNSLMWKRYEDEVPGRRMNNVWSSQMYPSDKRYVVETAAKVIQRCILMSTDPGDLVFDPTCGSGTTAYVSEQWGRRWITCDTSRVALTLARHRLMTADFDYYKLAYPKEGVGGGFECKKVRKVSPSILAEGKDEYETLHDRPEKDTKRVRVTGPFTVEAVPAPVVMSPQSGKAKPPPADDSIARNGETLRQKEWREELLKTGIRAKGGEELKFLRVDTFPGDWLHADTEATLGGETLRAVVCFGPEHAPMEQRQVENAIQEAHKLVPPPRAVIFAAFQFDPEAAKDIAEYKWDGTFLLKALMNPDMQTGDLKKQSPGSQSFWLVGQPEIDVRQIIRGDDVNRWEVEVYGFDYFDPQSGDMQSGGTEQIAVWMLDTDYDGRCIYPTQVFFPLAEDKNGGWNKLARNLKAEIDDELMEAYRGTVSLPFNLGENRRVAVKITDVRGMESIAVVQLPPTGKTGK